MTPSDRPGAPHNPRPATTTPPDPRNAPSEPLGPGNSPLDVQAIALDLDVGIPTPDIEHWTGLRTAELANLLARRGHYGLSLRLVRADQARRHAR
jgi:hypothetical protein